MKQLVVIFASIIFFSNGFSQTNTKNDEYDREEEIIHDKKRYRLHNNYLSVGAGYNYSSIREREQATIGVDFNFHIRRQYFQAGILMSGERFLSNNSIQGHLGYGYRKETEKYNFAFYAGPSYNTGIIPPVFREKDTLPARIFDAFGVYANVHYAFKLTYDIGIGFEAFSEFNQEQAYGGIKAIMFFSGSYRGKAKIYNKHVKPKK